MIKLFKIFWSQRRNYVFFLSFLFPWACSHTVICNLPFMFNIVTDLLSQLKVVSNTTASFSIMWNLYFNVRYQCNFKDSFLLFLIIYRCVFIWTWVQVPAVFRGDRSPAIVVAVLKHLLGTHHKLWKAMIMFICQTISLDHNVVLGNFSSYKS